MRRLSHSIIILTGLFLSSCNSCNKTEPSDTIRTGETKVAMDDSYIFLFETLARVFQDENPDAHIGKLIKNESDAIQALLDDSCKVIVLNRELTKNECLKFESKNIYPITNKIAYDAVALIGHPENPDSLLDIDDVKKILTGEITNWNQLGKNGNKEIVVVFDKPNSANYKYMKDSLLKGRELQKNCFGVNSNKEVIDYISKNRNAIGIISAGWINDGYSNDAKAYSKKVKALRIGHKSSGYYYGPYQYFIAERTYPFIRSVYVINRQTRMGLGTGFVNFVCRSDKGQLIISKSGLVPVYLYIRDIKANVE